LVASGAFDAVFGARCKLWDIAAGTIILTEAGGMLTDHHGQSYFPLDLASYQKDEPTPFLAAHPRLLKRLAEELAASH